MSARPRRGVDGEHGIALLIVLLTITLLTIVVIEFTQSAQVETHFALSGRNGLQAFYLARSGVNVAEALLAVDLKINNVDSDEDVWARPYPPLPVGDGTVAFRVQDEARRLNLNDLSGVTPPDRRRVFQRLFTILGIDPRVLAAIIDWVDSDADPSSDPPGAEQPYYLGITPPVVVRNGPMLTLRELLQVRGMTPTMFARLAEFVTVLPTGAPSGLQKVNVNTAPAEVLYALSDGLMADPGVVNRLIAARREQALLTNTDLPDGFSKALAENSDLITYSSTYFRIDAVGQVNDVTRGIFTIVRREGSGARPRITRVFWTPSTADLTLTSQPPSDFLKSLPPLGGG